MIFQGENMKKEHRLAAHIYGLSEPLADYCKKNNVTAAEATRIALCLLLGWKKIENEEGSTFALASSEADNDR